MKTLEASTATPGAAYLTPRGTTITVVGLTEDGRVRIRNAAGAHNDVPADFPLVDPSGEASVDDLVEELALLSKPALRARVAEGLAPDVLQGLYDVRPEDFVVEALKAAGGRVDAGDQDPACPECGKPTPTGIVTGKPGPVFRGHVGPDGSAYCRGSGQPVTPIVPPTVPSEPDPGNEEGTKTDADKEPAVSDANETPKTPTPAEEPALVLAVLPLEPTHYRELQEPSGLSSLDKVGRALTSLMTQGKAARVGRGLYQRIPEGQACPWDPATLPDTEAQLGLVKAIPDFAVLELFEAWPTIVRVNREIERHRTALEKLRVAYAADLEANHLGGPRLQKVFEGARIQERPGCIAFEGGLRRNEVDPATGYPRGETPITTSSAPAVAIDSELPEGTPVRYWKGVKAGPGTPGRTVGSPWKLGHGEYVVKIEGVAGGIALTHVEHDPDQAALFVKADGATLDKIENLLRRALRRHGPRGQTVVEAGSALLLEGEGRQLPISEVINRLEEFPADEAEAYLAHLQNTVGRLSRTEADLRLVDNEESDAIAADNQEGLPLVGLQGLLDDGRIDGWKVLAPKVLELQTSILTPDSVPVAALRAAGWAVSIPTARATGEDLVRRSDVLDVVEPARSYAVEVEAAHLERIQALEIEVEALEARVKELGRKAVEPPEFARLQDLVVLVQAELSLDEDDLDPVSWRQALIYRAGCEVVVEELGKLLTPPSPPDTLAMILASVKAWHARSEELRHVATIFDWEEGPRLDYKIAGDDAAKVRAFDKIRGYLELPDGQTDDVFDLVVSLDECLPEGPFRVYLRPDHDGLRAEIVVGSLDTPKRVTADEVGLPPGWELQERSTLGNASPMSHREETVTMKAVREATATQSLLELLRQAKADGLTVKVELSTD